MQSSDGEPGAIDDALQLHQTTGVDRHHRGCPGLLNGIDLGARHGARNLGELDGERAAKATALFRRAHFREREALHLCQQFSGAGLDLQFAQRVAAIVIGDDAVEARAYILNPGDFEQEARELPDARLECMGLGEELGIVLEEIREMMRDH